MRVQEKLTLRREAGMRSRKPKRPWLMGLFAVAIFGLAGRAEAAVQLQKVQVSDGSRVDLLFDAALDPAQLTTEYFNDIIQFSFTETNVYPAKILSVSGRDLTKVFAYQYAPGLVRCRLTVKGRAEDYKDRLQVSASGKVLSVKFGSGIAARFGGNSNRDVIQISAARPVSAARGGEGADESSGMTGDEKQLLQRVLQGGKSSVKARTGSSSRVRSAPAAVDSGASESGRLGGASDLPSPLRPFGYLLAICAVILAAGFGFRKFLGKGGATGAGVLSHRGLGTFLSRIGVSVPSRDRRNLIEVLASHPLGQKKSLAIVRVGGVRMVLGISDESINLISRLSSEDDAEEAAMESAGASSPSADDLLDSTAAYAGGGAAFEDAIAASLLGGNAQVPGRSEAVRNAGASATAAGRPVFASVLGQEARRQGARDQIRNRLGSMKPL